MRRNARAQLALHRANNVVVDKACHSVHVFRHIYCSKDELRGCWRVVCGGAAQEDRGSQLGPAEGDVTGTGSVCSVARDGEKQRRRMAAQKTKFFFLFLSFFLFSG